ncbi:MAG: 8-amino-7-oxononanoate synthase [Acetobacter sp.]
MMGFDDLFLKGLDTLGGQGRLRSCRSWHGAGPGLLRADDGAVLVDFSSNDYLGLRTHPLLAHRAQDWAREEGSGSGASRLVTGTSPQVARLERRVADLKGMQAARLFSSGWQANASIVPALARLSMQETGAPAIVIVDRLIHASLYHGCAAAGLRPRRFRHNDMDHLRTLLEQAEGPGLRIILTESVFSMDGDRADLDSLHDLVRRHHAFLCVDEAHATGVLGESGKGLVAGRADLVIGTFSKALGSMGAFVAASDPVCRWLENAASGFVFSTAPSPLVLGAVDAALDLLPAMEEARRHTASLADAFRKDMLRAGLDVGPSSTQIVPVLIGGEAETLAVARRVEQAGFLAVAIRPPTVPPGRCRLSVVLHSHNTHATLNSLA